MSRGSSKVRLKNWLLNQGPYHIWLFLWILGQGGIFFSIYWYYRNNDNFSTFRSFAKGGLPVARGAAAVLDVAAGLVLIPVCRNLISMLRLSFVNRIFPFDFNIHFHRILGWSIVFWSAVHTVAHLFNVRNYCKNTGMCEPSKFIYVLRKSPESIVDQLITLLESVVVLFTHPTALTGVALVLILFLMATSAFHKVRRHYFEQFWYTHHLYLLWFPLLLLHGSFCFVKRDTEPHCGLSPSFWKYWVVSAVLFGLERLAREWRGRMSTQLSKVIQHPSRVVELQIRKPSAKMHPGQYIFLCIPELSLYQWHPFTLTSTPEEPFLSVHMRMAGDWTESVAKRLGCEWDKQGRCVKSKSVLGSKAKFTLPRVMVDGPYGAASEDVFNFEVAVLVGAGIGVTPFGSVLKHIWYRIMHPVGHMALKKVYFLWVCRDTEAFEWFRDVLAALEEENVSNFIDIRIYLTAKMKDNDLKNLMLQHTGQHDPITGLRAPTLFGRPNLDKFFVELQRSHPALDVGVFYCGPKALCNNLYEACNKHSQNGEKGTRFYFHKENF